MTNEQDDEGDTDIEPLATRAEYDMSATARIVYMAGGVVTALLGLRFLLSIIGVSHANLFAKIIFNTSHPFVMPFFGIFNYREHAGVNQIEWGTLVAIVVYSIVAVSMVWLVMIGRRRVEL